MIDEATKDKLIVELEKNGNISIACMKIGVNRATYYRWKKEDKNFMKKANQSVKYGRENNCDLGEHALMLKVKAQDLNAIKYLLGHNSPRYKNKQNSNVVIVHKKELPNIIDNGPKTFEDIMTDYETNGEERAKQLLNSLTEYGGQIPNKPDGTPIDLMELLKYEAYIRNWQEANKDKFEHGIVIDLDSIDTED